MFTLSSMKIGMRYQDVRNEIIKSKNLIMRCLPTSCNSNYNVVENLDTKEKFMYWEIVIQELLQM